MPGADATLTISIGHDPNADSRMLLVRCPHGTTTLPLPPDAPADAERAAVTLAVLQHYRTTGCTCTRGPPHGRRP